MRPAIGLAVLLAACSSPAPARDPGAAGGAGGGGGEGGTVAPCDGGRTSCQGACVDLSASRENCGACGHPCAAGEVCDGGTCSTFCAAPLQACDGACTDVQRHEAHCGTCDHACAEGEICAGGTCRLLCEPGRTQCDAACVDLGADLQHCGACDRSCAPGETCESGSCEPPCPRPELLCGETCVDPTDDPLHCGACDRACAPGEPCTDGACKPVPVELRAAVSWTTVDMPEVLRIPVRATFSDGSVRDVTGEVRWTTAGPDVIDIAGPTFVPMSAGKTAVFANLGGLQACVGVVVRPWAITALADKAVHASLSGVNQGDALVGFAKDFQIQAARYTPGKGWEAPVVVASRSFRAGALAAGLAGRGDRILLWTEDDGSAIRLWGSQSVLGKAFTAPARIDRLGTALDGLAISVSHVGRAVATFSQLDPAAGSVDLYTSVINAGGIGLASALATGAAGRPAVATLGDAFVLAASADAVEAFPFSTTTGWGQPAGLASGGDHSSPLVGVDTYGNGLAVWVEDLGPSRLLRAASFTVGQGWAGLVDLADGEVVAPVLGMNLGGRAVVAWRVREDGVRRGWAARRDDQGVWSKAERFDGDSKRDVLEVSVATDGDDAVVALWTERDGESTVLLANHRDPMCGWGLPYVVARSARLGSIVGPQITANYLHVPVAVWTEVQSGADQLWGAAVP